MRRAPRSLALAVAITAFAFAPARAETIRVFAAASLAEAFQDVAALFRAQNPRDAVEFNFAGSQVLRAQIEEGAPADLFAPADHAQMDALAKRGLAEPEAVFARNRLVVVTPRAIPKVQRLADLARPGVRIVVADPNVPVGRYTAQALDKMSRVEELGDDFRARVMANVVSHETNVRAVLAKTALDEVDAGFVYATDARTAAAKVASLEIPDRMNVIAEYPIALVSESAAKACGARFVALLHSEAGQAILRNRGFEAVR